MQAGGVSGAQNAGLALGVGGEAGAAKSAEGAHSQFGAVSAGPASASFFEEASITLSSLRKFKTKDSKEDKDLKKQLERLKETIPDMPGMEKMNKFLQQMQEAKKNGSLTKEQIKQFSDEYSGDSSHQYLALKILAESLEESDPELAGAIREHNAEFYDENKLDIQAGINVSGEHYELAAQSGLSEQECRDDKRNNLMRIPDLKGSASDAYQHAKQVAGSAEKIPERLDIWKQGYSWELLALKNMNMTSATDSAQLVHIRQNLEVIFGLKTIIEFGVQNEAATGRMMVNARE